MTGTSTWMAAHSRRPKLKPRITVVAMEMAARSKSPKWPAKACVMTFIPYMASLLKMAGPAIRHSFLDSSQNILPTSFEHVNDISSELISTSFSLVWFSRNGTRAESPAMFGFVCKKNGSSRLSKATTSMNRVKAASAFIVWYREVERMRLKTVDGDEVMVYIGVAMGKCVLLSVSLQIDVDDLLRRLEAVETRLQEDDSKDEGQAIQPHPQVQDPFERLIDAFTKQRKKEKPSQEETKEVEIPSEVKHILDDYQDILKELPERQDEMVVIDKILDRRLGKETRNKKYFEYLVSWKDKSIEEAVWMDEGEVMKLGVSLEDLKEWF
eukprot:Gb_22192 [translate_table: standard]